MPDDHAQEAETRGQVVIVGDGVTSTCLQLLYSASRENDPTIQAVVHALGETWPRSTQLLETAAG